MTTAPTLRPALGGWFYLHVHVSGTVNQTTPQISHERSTGEQLIFTGIVIDQECDLAMCSHGLRNRPGGHNAWVQIKRYNVGQEVTGQRTANTEAFKLMTYVDQAVMLADESP